MPLVRSMLAFLAAAGIWSCGEASPAMQVVMLDLIVESDPGMPLEGVRIAVDGKPVGVSGGSGELRTSIAKELGSLVRIEHDCPEGYRDSMEPATLRLRDNRSLRQTSLATMEIALRCPPSKRIAVIVVRAQNGGGLPVLVDDRIVGRTNADGVAHVSTLAAPGTELDFRLDTSMQPLLAPRSPSRVLTVPDAHELFLIDQAFEISRRPPRKRNPPRKIIKIE